MEMKMTLQNEFNALVALEARADAAFRKWTLDLVVLVAVAAVAVASGLWWIAAVYR
jgi:hypothetical protein